MIPWALAAAALAVELADVDALDLVRVDDPDFPGAVARSATGAVLLAPPTDGTPWWWESVPRVDGWPATEALEAMNVGPWHDAGWRGQGVRVAVFDVQWFGAEARPDALGVFGTADCWAHVSCELEIDSFRARFPFEEGVHGVACAQAVRDVAPEAELFLLRVNGFTALENGVRWAIRNEIDVISMSMSFFNASFYDGTGRFAALMDTLAAADVLMVTSAGNYAREHWSGPWIDADLDGRLDFGGDNALTIQYGGNGRRSIFVNWDEHRMCGGSDLDAFVYDPSGQLVGAGSTRQRQDGDTCSPVERVGVELSEAGPYRLEVRARRVVTTGLGVDVFATGGTVQGGNASFSIVDPATHPAVFTVGAVYAQGYLDNDIEGFSSQGPVRSGAAKPDVAGPDGLSGVAYGAEGFFGTSAATPAVAGAVALVMSRYPELGPYEAAARLKTWAIGDDPRQADPRWGAGKVRLPVPEPTEGTCGRRPLWACVLLAPMWWRRRR